MNNWFDSVDYTIIGDLPTIISINHYTSAVLIVVNDHINELVLRSLELVIEDLIDITVIDDDNNEAADVARHTIQKTEEPV